MTMRQFIRENKDTIDACIKLVSNERINNEERRLWVLNDEGLYFFAKSKGVRI